MNTAPELLKRLYQRQLNMIAIGGVIGAGLFTGSSVVLSTACPGAFLTYAISNRLDASRALLTAKVSGFPLAVQLALNGLSHVGVIPPGPGTGVCRSH